MNELDRLRAMFAQGAWEDTKTQLKLFLETPALPVAELAAAYSLQASVFEQESDLPAAVTALQEALLLEPENARLHDQLCSLYLTLSWLEPALQHAEAARAYAPEQLECTFQLIDLYLLLGRREDALIYCQEALQLAPEHEGTFRRLGQALWLFGRSLEARAALLQSLECAPEQYENYLILAQFLVQDHNWFQAIALLLRIPEARLSHLQKSRYAYLLGLCFYWQGDIGQAREALQYSLSLHFEQSTLLRLALVHPLVYHDSEDRQKWELLLFSSAELLLNSAGPGLIEAFFQGAYSTELQGKLLMQLGQALQTEAVAPEFEAAERPFFQVGLLVASLQTPQLLNAVEVLLATASEQIQLKLFYLQPASLPLVLERWAGQCFQLSRHPQGLYEELLRFELDALIYLDLTAETYFVALKQPAPLQFRLPLQTFSWGLPQIHYLFGGPVTDLAEGPEKVLRLPSPSLLASKIPLQPLSRQELDLPKLGHLYLCPLYPHQWSCEFDAVIAELLSLDRKAFVVALQLPQSSAHTLIQSRHLQTLGERHHRVKWLDVTPGQVPELLTVTDLLLEAPGQGCAWLAWQALHLGVPVVATQQTDEQAAFWLTELGFSDWVQPPEKMAVCAAALLSRKADDHVMMLKERLKLLAETPHAQTTVSTALISQVYEAIKQHYARSQS